MKKAEEALEFDRIVSLLTPYFAFEANALSFPEEEMITDPGVLSNEHRSLLEAEGYLQEGHQAILLHVYDLGESFQILVKGGILTIKGLADFIPFLDDLAVLKDISKEVSRSIISSLALQIKDFRWIKDRLSEAILPDLTLADDASENLYAIRVKLKKAQASISDALRAAAGKYSDYLAEVPQTIKGGLPALAVRSDFKNRVPGMTADISNTGSTTFIVPMEVLDIQNKIFELKEEEVKEIERITKELTGLLKDSLEDLDLAYKAALRLDSLLARAKFGLSYKGTVATNSDDLSLQDLAHPLLDAQTVIRNNVSLGGGKAKILVVTGPNAGGKTVLIKAVSLAVMMNQRGLLVCALGEARLPLFSKVFFLAGDSQSIMDSLSTFSGHIASIRDALKELDKDSFLVIDEIGQGTSPSDGEALGVAVIDYIKAHGGFAILTSHYDGIKEKAFSDPSCLVGAMIFDEQTIKPTFRYQEGMIGKSYALEVSASLGLDSSIIQEAKDYVTEKNRQSGREALEQAIALQQENLRLKDEYEKKIKEAEELTAKRQRALDALSHEKEAVMRKADDKVDELVQSRIADLDLAYKNKKISLQQLAELKGKLSKMQVPNSPNQKKTAYHHPLAVGDKVNVGSLNNSGTLIQIDEKRGTASVKIGSIAVKTNVSDLTFLEAAGALKVKPQVAVQDQYIEHKTGVPLEVNLIGLRQDEAREKLDKYLDDCILMKFHQVRIIHGNGTGALRTMVQKYLKSNPNVASFRFGEGGEGGVGVTVATLK